MDIARVVGADRKNDGYCAGGGYMVTWALGHLVSLALPDAYGYTKTAEEDLPMLPEPFRLVSRQVRTDRGMVPDLAASKQLDIRLPGLYETVQTAVDLLAHRRGHTERSGGTEGRFGL